MRSLYVVVVAAALSVAGTPRAPWAEAQVAEPLREPRAPRILALSRKGEDEGPALRTIEQSLAAGQWTEARAAAESVLAAVSSAEDRVKALANLGTVELRSGNPSAAATRFEQAIALVESDDSIAELRLADALYGLGLARAELGSQREAAAAIGRAIFVRRTTLGLKSAEQLEFHEALVDALLALGEDEEVMNRELARVMLVEQATGRGSAEHLAALRDAAASLGEARYFGTQLDLYDQAIDLLQAEGDGRNDIAVVDLLHAKARALMDDLIRPTSALDQLRAARFIQRSSQDVPKLQQAKTLVLHGDNLLIFGEDASARRAYHQAFTETGREAKVLETFFSEPTLAYIERPRFKGEGRRVLAVVDAAFGVDEKGEVQGLRIHSIDPPVTDEAQQAIRKALARAIFRPRISDRGYVFRSETRQSFRFVAPAAS